jgi:hypothetical protein
MPLTPIASNNPVRAFESGDPNSAIVMNVAPQGLLNQAFEITTSLETIVATQQTIATKITQLADAIALKNNATAVKNTLISESAESVTADTQASSVESGITPLTSAISTENGRAIPINNKLDGITNSTYQAHSPVLTSIAGATASANNYLYSANDGAIGFSTPSLSSGTRLRDIILEARIAPGSPNLTFANETWVNIPMVQALNMTTTQMSWNQTTQELTLLGGEYHFEGYVAASRAQLVQMGILQGATQYFGTSGKGTSEGGVVGSANLTIYSHFINSFNFGSSRVFLPQLFLSGGEIVASTLGENTPWAMLRVRHYLY